MKSLKTIILIMATITISCAASRPRTHAENTALLKASGLASDTFTTPAGRTVAVYFIKHASLILDIDGYIVYIDPTTIYGNDYAALPKADLLLVTHSHHDHLDPKADNEIIADSTRLVGGGDVSQHDPRFSSVRPGDIIDDTCAHFSLTCTPAYNTTPDHLQYHPRDRHDTGFLFDINGMRIYVAGDTEDIPEMASLGHIDIAFLPVNQPYTMTPEQAIHAAEMIRPKILYPYHYGQTDLTPITDHFKSSPATQVRIRQMQ